MSTTPWGRAEKLRARRLNPGPGKSREGVARNQRERLLGAIVHVTAEKGYEATTVADVLEIAGVGRNAFYRLFANKHDCFMAALDAIGELAGPTVIDIYDATPGPWDVRLGAMLDALAATIVAQPAAARVAWVEVHAAGPEAVERVERIDARVEKTVLRALADSPAHADPPPGGVTALIGGLRKIVHTRVRERRETELPELMPQVLEWILTYRSPPEPLRRPRRPPPGLIPAPTPPRNGRERIIVALTELVAENGYAGTAIADIAQRASVSLSTFYANFEDKRDAFVAAIEHGRHRIDAATAPVIGAADDWPHAIASGVHALLALFASDPPAARLGGVVAYEGGERGLRSRDAVIVDAQEYLREGYRQFPGTPVAAAEGVGAAVYALLSRHAREGRVDRLYESAPLAAYIVLAPFVGAERAVATANATPAVPWDPNGRTGGGPERR